MPLSAQIAQLVEHVLGKDEVAGSNPVLGSRSSIKKTLSGKTLKLITFHHG